MNIKSDELRQKFLDFFEKYPGLEHQKLESAPLVPSDEEQLEGKEKVLFTSAGMQPLIPYLTGKKDPPNKRLVDCQKCVRTDDIEEVGDATHHTFFEMLGNWSIGDYWKDQAIELSFNFLIKELEIPIEKIAVTVFAGDEDAPKDKESANKWKELGISEERIAYLGKEDNWWPSSRREVDGTLKNAFGPCGPDTEMFYWTGKSDAPEKFDPKDSTWVEIWNDVFMQYNRKDDGTLEDLPQRNVDTGMGLERTLAVLNGKDNNYETDLFEPILSEVEKSQNNYSEKSKRIISDHLKAAVFLIAAGIDPNPKDSRGSVVHRLITLAIYQENKQLEQSIVDSITKAVLSIYKDSYTDLKAKEFHILSEINNVVGGLYYLVSGPVYLEMKKDLEMKYKLPNSAMAAAATISLYHQSKGMPEPVAFGTAENIGYDLMEIKPNYEALLRKHREASRVEKGAFKGGLAGHSEIEIKYHTTTHLLHQALRDVLGPEVFQKGSNITPERLRFDFSFDRKMTEEEVKKTEAIINERIKQDLKVDHMTIPIEKARELNAIGLFDDKYAKDVSIYAVGPDFSYDPEAKDKRERGGYYSMEFCGGPHVEHTGLIGTVKIQKEEAVSAGMRRIRAIVE